MKLTNRWIGLIAGLVAGALLILAGWRVFLILLGFAVAGYITGMYLESRTDVIARVHAFFDRLFGG